MAVQPEDHIADAQIRPVGGAAGQDVGHSEVLAEHDAEARVLDVLAREHPRQHAQQRVDRDRERDAGPGADRALDPRGHADQLACAVDQYSAGVPGVQGCIRLDHGELCALGWSGRSQRAVEAGDDPDRQRVLEPVRGADRGDPVADSNAVKLPVVQQPDRDIAVIDSNHREIVRGVRSDQLGLGVLAGPRADGDFLRAVDDVEVGHDMAVVIDEEARALAQVGGDRDDGRRDTLVDRGGIEIRSGHEGRRLGH